MDSDGSHEPDVDAFKALQDAARSAAGIENEHDPMAHEVYEQYREWLPFEHRNRIVLGRIADALGYELG